MGLAALFQAVAALYPSPAAARGLPVLTPAQKAALVVVSGLPAPPGAGRVIVRTKDRGHFPRRVVVLADQEGGVASAFADLPPRRLAAAFHGKRAAFISGRATHRALRRLGVRVDLAPDLDLAGGPLGLRHFGSPSFGVAFARGLGRAACVKHFPGHGSASTESQSLIPFWFLGVLKPSRPRWKPFAPARISSSSRTDATRPAPSAPWFRSLDTAFSTTTSGGSSCAVTGWV